MSKIEPIIYNSETRSFGWMSKAAAATTGLSLAAAAMGAHQQFKNYSGKVKFSVVYLINNKPASMTVSATSPIEANRIVSSKHPGASKIKAFRLPDQDDQSQEYYNSLK